MNTYYVSGAEPETKVTNFNDAIHIASYRARGCGVPRVEVHDQTGKLVWWIQIEEHGGYTVPEYNVDALDHYDEQYDTEWFRSQEEAEWAAQKMYETGNYQNIIIYEYDVWYHDGHGTLGEKECVWEIGE